jgi:hypothetical protein
MTTSEWRSLVSGGILMSTLSLYIGQRWGANVLLGRASIQKRTWLTTAQTLLKHGAGMAAAWAAVRPATAARRGREQAVIR